VSSVETGRPSLGEIVACNLIAAGRRFLVERAQFFANRLRKWVVESVSRTSLKCSKRTPNDLTVLGFQIANGLNGADRNAFRQLGKCRSEAVIERRRSEGFSSELEIVAKRGGLGAANGRKRQDGGLDELDHVDLALALDDPRRQPNSKISSAPIM
jgi:hypothetical protein